MSNMKDILSKTFIFAVGVTIGVVTTRKYFKTKYEKIAKEEIDSVTEQLLGNDYVKTDIPDTEVSENDTYYDTEEPSGYKKMVNELKYAYSAGDKEENDLAGKQVISLEEFEDGENPTITLYYWADGVITNDRNKIIKNVDELIGLNNLKAFNDHRVDSIYIRNYDSEVDYEILRDSRCFSEIS